jgi:arylsulfatase A-like enzyme
MASKLSRRAFLGAAAGSTLAVRSLASPANRQRRSPNVIFAYSDEHRWQSMSFTEMPSLQTPNMARMAKEGAQFTHCISNYPVCSPYRAMLLTGRWPYQQGVVDNGLPLSANEPTIAKTFQAAGYRTGYIGKWHLVGERAEPFGFDHSLIWDNTNVHWDKSRYFPASGAPVTPKGYNATLMTDQALEFIETQLDRPFFLMVSWNPPHASFTDPPPDKKALYPGGSLPRRANFMERALTGTTADRFFSRNGSPEYEGYHAHISAIDEELGRLLAKLDELDLSENTILIYSSDHGSMFGSHGVGGKRQPYEESIRVPMLVRHPGAIPAGRRIDALLGTIDLFPTLCGLAGLDAPRHCEGIDFSRHVFSGEGPEPRSQFIMHIDKKNASGGANHPAPIFRGVRTERHMYASLPEGGGLLFDLQEDPYQLHNLHGQPSERRTQQNLARVLDKWLRAAHDPYVSA